MEKVLYFYQMENILEENLKLIYRMEKEYLEH